MSRRLRSQLQSRPGSAWNGLATCFLQAIRPFIAERYATGADLGTREDEIIAGGRVSSRRPRPWLGLQTAGGAGGVVVEGFNEAGPARAAGFRLGDRIIGVDGARVATQEEFYERLWRRQAGDTIDVAVRRGASERVISVRSMDRYSLYRTSQ